MLTCDEQEIYLLEMRLNKLPYKKIASHLDKTELACRLHYHQLSHGNNRRKTSISSNTSDKSPGPSETVTHASSIPSVLAAGKKGSLITPCPQGIRKPRINTASKLKAKPLLPKPSTLAGHGTIPRGNPRGKPLRVNCSIENIDKEKLLQIVEFQRQKFWEAVANEYGGSFAPEFLEQAYNDGTASAPPTPADSPAASIKSGDLDSRFAAGSPELADTPEEVEPESMDLSESLVEEVKPETKELNSSMSELEDAEGVSLVA